MLYQAQLAKRPEFSTPVAHIDQKIAKINAFESASMCNIIQLSTKPGLAAIWKSLVQISKSSLQRLQMLGALMCDSCS